MKVIFLDIDGVLNSHDAHTEGQCGRFHPEKVEALNSILRATGALIVLSSAWRYLVHRNEMTIAGLGWLLRSHGVMAGRLAGITRPDTMIHVNGARAFPAADERGLQIADFLADWPLIDAYIVIDDLDLGIAECGHPFLQVDPMVGLRMEHVPAVVALLGESPR